jgi:hypothetical protein
MSRLHAIKCYYDSDVGQLVELDDDVLGIVSQVNQLYGGRVAINLDPRTGWYHFTEHCEDQTERLIFSVDVLDGRALERLMKADSQWRGHKDPYDAAEREQDEAQAALDEAYREKLREHGERLAHAIKKDGIDDRLPLTVAMSGRKGRRGHK